MQISTYLEEIKSVCISTYTLSGHQIDSKDNPPDPSQTKVFQWSLKHGLLQLHGHFCHWQGFEKHL